MKHSRGVAQLRTFLIESTNFHDQAKKPNFNLFTLIRLTKSEIIGLLTKIKIHNPFLNTLNF